MVSTRTVGAVDSSAVRSRNEGLVGYNAILNARISKYWYTVHVALRMPAHVQAGRTGGVQPYNGDTAARISNYWYTVHVALRIPAHVQAGPTVLTSKKILCPDV
jgi:hypothetical protein